MQMTLDGRTLHYEIHGAGAPVLFLHGFPLSGELWTPLVPALERTFRLIIPDLRGHGRSAPSASVTMAGFADDIVALLERVREERPVVVVGMSLGGYVAFELCRRAPERVRALVLTNTRAQADSADDARTRRETAERVRAEGSVVVVEAMLPKLFGPGAPEALRARWRAIMAATPPEGVAAALEAMAARPNSFATLGSLARAVLIVAGEHDALMPLEDARRMREAAPGSRIEILEGAGHMGPVEAPERFVGALRRFLDELSPLDAQDAGSGAGSE